MGEQAPAVQNKGMLIVAAVLGAAVVGVYNLQIEAVRREGRGEQATILRFERDMVAGQKLDIQRDISKQQVSKKLADGLADVVVIQGDDDLRSIRDLPVNKRIYRGQFLTNSMLTSEQRTSMLPLNDPADVALGVPIREQYGIGNILLPGNYVNLVAHVPDRSGKLIPMRILKRVFVLAVGGRGVRQELSGPAAVEEGSTSYRTITIEVSEQTSLDLQKVLIHVGGTVIVEGVQASAARLPGEGQVPPEVLRIVESGVGGVGTSPLRPGGG